MDKEYPEVEWHDVEYEEPPTDRLLWIYLGGNQIELSSLIDMTGIKNYQWNHILCPGITFDKSKVLAWGEFVYPPAPRRMWR